MMKHKRYYHQDGSSKTENCLSAAIFDQQPVRTFATTVIQMKCPFFDRMFYRCKDRHKTNKIHHILDDYDDYDDYDDACGFGFGLDDGTSLLGLEL